MNRPIHYRQRACEDRGRMDQFLAKTRIGVLGLEDGGEPYAVPVNFIWHDGCVYFHGMGSGRKEELLAKGPKTCFTVFKEFGTVTDPVPCHADTSYFSVMIFGSAQKVTDFQESALVLQELSEKYLPGYYKEKLSARLMEKYRSSLDSNPVSVYKIKAERITAKENAAEAAALFQKDTSN